MRKHETKLSKKRNENTWEKIYKHKSGEVTLMNGQKALATSTRPVVPDLRRNYLSFPDTMAQSIANIAPTATPALAIPLVAANAGMGTWFVYLLATVGLALVGMNISAFARRFATSGSMYTYVTRGLGATAGFLSGWGLLAAYLFTAMATLLAFGIFVNQIIGHFGKEVPSILLYAVGGGAIWYLAYKDIKFSSVLALFLEFVSVGLIAVMGSIVLANTGFKIDTAQFSLQGVTLSGLDLAMVLAVFSFVGFESAATLGKESRNPFWAIPRAIIISTVVVGLFFALMSYIQVVGFGSLSELTNSESPMNDLTTKYHVGWFGLLIDFGASISFFSCSLASINAASRIMYAMGRDKIFHESIGRAHSTNQTPHIAVTICSVLNFLVPTLMVGLKPMDAYGYLGTSATYGFLLVYILISIATTVYLSREGQLKPYHVLLSVGGVLVMLVPLVGSFYPVPSFPYNLFPYLFLFYLLIGIVWFRRVAGQNPASLKQIAMDFDANEEIIFSRK